MDLNQRKFKTVKVWIENNKCYKDTNKKMTAFLILLLLVATVQGDLSTHSEVACDGNSLTIRCPGNNLIKIQTATYGRQDDRICVVDNRALMRNTHCSLKEAFSDVTVKCNAKSECTFVVGPGMFSDPCPGTSKYLSIMWECVPFITACPGLLESVSSSDNYLTNKMADAAWVRDPFQQTKKIYYMGWAKYESPQLEEYANLKDMITNDAITFHHMRDRIDGTGFIVYDGSVYYNKERSRTVVKYNFGASEVDAEADLPGANYHDTSPYGIEKATDIDMAVDESGLWAIYATEANDGKIVLSRLEHHSLKILNTWRTSYDKLSALNAFVICGVLYVVNYETLRINYMYNTTSSTEKEINVYVPGISKATSAINYNPSDQSLYVWKDKEAILLNIGFQSLEEKPTEPPTIILPSSTTTTTTASTRTPAVVRPIEPVNPVSTTTIKPFTNSSFIPDTEIRYCIGEEKNGLIWPDTPYSQIAMIQCPGQTGSNAIWICGGTKLNPQWTTKLPDLTLCSSDWIREIQNELMQGLTGASAMCTKFERSLEKHKSNLASWDIYVTVDIIQYILDSTGFNAREASAITDCVLKVTNTLLDPVVDEAWSKLSSSVQTDISYRLASLVEKSAFVLAKDMSVAGKTQTSSPSNNDNNLNWSGEYVAIGIRIVPVVNILPPAALRSDWQPNSTIDDFTNLRGQLPQQVTWQTGQGDVVTIDDLALVESLRPTIDEKLVVVYMAFEGLGKSMSDSTGFGGSQFPVNSKILTVSTGIVDKNNNIRVSPAHPLFIKRPLVFTLEMPSKDFQHHACVYWNTVERGPGNWAQGGCILAASNKTHATCECDHLTNFAVLSSDRKFPSNSLGPEWEKPVESKPYSINVEVVFSGIIISVMFLIITFITLLVYSNSMDLNTIHKNMAFCLIASEVLFVVGISANLEPTACFAISVLFHFGFLCVFTWAAIESYHLYVVLSDLVPRDNRWRLYYLIGYIFPLIIAVISGAVNFKGYQRESDICLSHTNGSAIWSFIGPCVFLICFCVIALSLVLKRLHKTRFPGPAKCKKIRNNTAKTCASMFLLCAMWSCGVMWIYDIQSQFTAYLFCVFCTFHAISTYVFYCVLPKPVRHLYYNCFRRLSGKEDPMTSSPNRFYLDNTSHNQTLQCTLGGRDTLASRDRTGTAEFHYRPGFAASGNEINQIPHVRHESQPLMTDGYCLTCERTMQTRCTAISSASQQFDDTDPKLPSSSHNTRRLHSASHACNHYVRPGSGGACEHCDVTASHHHHVAGSNHYYEQSQCSNAHPTMGSACYDRLHDIMRDPLPAIPNYNNELGVVAGYPPTSSCFLSQPRLSRPHSHLYETLGTPHQRSMTSLNNTKEAALLPQHQPVPLQRRNCYEDVEHRVDYCPPSTRTDCQSCLQLHTQDTHPVHSHANCGYALRAPDVIRPQTQRVATGSVSSRRSASHHINKSGRRSDPLSTDQGYDTDSQQPQAVTRLFSGTPHSEGHTSNWVEYNANKERSHRDSVNTLSSASVDPTIPEKSASNSKLNGQVSVDSDGSENDMEVELITQSSSRVPKEDETEVLINDLKLCSHKNPKPYQPDSIETGEGGNNSISGSVTSWSAVIGSNPRAFNALYGLSSENAKKKTPVDPQVILDNAHRQQRTQSRESASDAGEPSTSANSTFAYTLPGTAEAGTKARIDLRSGGISMVTNL